MAHGDAREGKWRGNWRMEWVLFTLPRNMVYPALLPLMRTPRLPIFDWTDAPADLNGLVRFAERRNLVSARVPSQFKRSQVLINVSTTVFQCDSGYWFSVAFRHICRFTASPGVILLRFIAHSTSISHFVVGLPLLSPPPFDGPSE